jgi:FkbM family methyltransferase
MILAGAPTIIGTSGVAWVTKATAVDNGQSPTMVNKASVMNLPACLFYDRCNFETACRAASQAVYVGNGTLLCRVLSHYLMFVDATDLGFTPHLCLDGYWESWVTLAVARALTSGCFCLDIGANHGYYSLLLAEAARENGRLLACEPNPRLSRLLHNTLEVNGIGPWARLVPQAITDVPGHTVQLVLPAFHSLNSTICREGSAGEEVIPVKTTTVDDLTADWPRVDFIKIDAEGAEELIWRGMHRTVCRCPELCVVMEFRADRYADPTRFLEEIETAGFPLRAIGADSQLRALSPASAVANPANDIMLFLRRA